MKVRLEFGQHYERVWISCADGGGSWLPLLPDRSQAVFNHSPDGFSWGYGGSGPSQLALALLLEAGLDDERAVRLHQDFKHDFVANWSHDGPGDIQVQEIDVDAWVAAHA